MQVFADGLALWPPVVTSFGEVMDTGLPFHRNKANQGRLT